jgi:hypothetical protein
MVAEFSLIEGGVTLGSGRSGRLSMVAKSAYVSEIKE